MMYLVYHTDLDFECLATWSDGADTYMYGKFNGPGMVEKEKRYRCFVSNHSFNTSWDYFTNTN